MEKYTLEIVKIQKEIQQMSLQIQEMKQFILDDIQDNSIPVPITEYQDLHQLIEEIQTHLEDLQDRYADVLKLSQMLSNH